jgi:hypothetical protein
MVVDTPGPSGVVPTAPKRARSGSAKKAVATAASPHTVSSRGGVETGGDSGGGGSSVVAEGRWPKRARRSGGSGSVAGAGGSSGNGGSGGSGGEGAEFPTAVARERMMNASEATATNLKLPAGWLYVKSEDAA